MTISTSATMSLSQDRMKSVDSLNRIFSKRSAAELVNAVMLAPNDCLSVDDFHIGLENLIQVIIS
jgi:hypothetical protein